MLLRLVRYYPTVCCYALPGTDLWYAPTVCSYRARVPKWSLSDATALLSPFSIVRRTQCRPLSRAPLRSPGPSPYTLDPRPSTLDPRP
eukprot:343135-Rhodomonas_salina.1